LSLQAAEEMMSSSRIIKPEGLKDSQVCRVNYGMLVDSSLPRNGESAMAYLEAEGFTPLFFNDGVGVQGGAEKHPSSASMGETTGDGIYSEPLSGEPPEGMQLIAEDEMQRHLSEAYARGLEEGRLAAERGLAHVFKALREGADALAALRDKVLRGSEVDMLKLSIMVARKIILQEVKLDRQILANIIAATLSCCSEQEKVTIRLNPEDYRVVMSDQQLFLSGKVDDSRIALASDDSIKLGGCMVETPTGTVDSRIEAQLEEVFNRCLEERGIPQDPSVSLDDER
jgi:flagellar assembly protein FliH